MQAVGISHVAPPGARKPMSSGTAAGLDSRMTITLVLPGRIARGDIPALCERVRMLLEPHAGPIVCDAGAISQPDAASVDALARLQLTARAFGCRLSFTHMCDELEALISLVGLDDVLPMAIRSGVEPVGQPEEGKQVRGIEEEADASDAIA